MAARNRGPAQERKNHLPIFGHARYREWVRFQPTIGIRTPQGYRFQVAKSLYPKFVPLNINATGRKLSIVSTTIHAGSNARYPKPIRSLRVATTKMNVTQRSGSRPLTGRAEMPAYCLTVSSSIDRQPSPSGSS